MSLAHRLSSWIGRHAPGREELAKSRWLRPVGSRVARSDYWRFTRRSVPRGVAVGLFVGVFLLVPGVQIIGAALLSLPVRGNIPIAAAMTFLTNPITTPFLLIGALWLGSQIGFAVDIAAFGALYSRGAGVTEWLAWLLSDAAPALVSGLFLIAVAAGALGYVVSVWVWRWWTWAKWRRRQRRPAREIS